MDAVAELKIVEHVFEAGLAVVKVSVDCKRMYVRFSRCGHLAALYFGDAAMGVKDKDVDVIKALESLNRGRTCVTRCSAHDCHAFASAAQGLLEHLADQLHGEVFECQSRAVEEFEQVMVWGQLHHGRARGMAKGCVGVRDQRAKLSVGEGVTDKGAHNGKGDVLVGLPGHRGDLICAERWNCLRHVKPAVSGKAGQHGLFKGQGRGGATGRNVAHKYAFGGPLIYALRRRTK